jgi:hypothetical protein
MTSRSEAVPTRPARWSRAEIERLEMLAGDVPTPELFRRYNSWAVRQRPPFQHRTPNAIYHQAKIAGFRLRCYGEYVTIVDVTQILGIGPRRVRRWINRELVSVRRHRYCYISRADLVAMAWQHPQEFHSIARDRLYQLLEADDVVDHVLSRANTEPGPSKPRPVRCVETGFQWSSVRAASRALFVDPGSISKAIRCGCTSAGHHWEFVA